MDSEKLTQVITAHYEEWSKYVSKVATDYQLNDEAMDILNDVLYNVLKRNKDKPIRLQGTGQSEENEIKYYLIRAIKLAIILPSSRYRRHLQNITKMTSHPDNFSSLILTDEEETGTDKLEMIYQAVEKLCLSENDQKIFDFCYSGYHVLKQWDGEESISTVSRKSNSIRKMIRKQVDIDKKLKITQKPKE